ncbi:MAG: hypothetical protein Q9175_002492 [Cornicularia normoerica]
MVTTSSSTASFCSVSAQTRFKPYWERMRAGDLELFRSQKSTPMSIQTALHISQKAVSKGREQTTRLLKKRKPALRTHEGGRLEASKEAKTAEDKFITDLALKYEKHDHPLFNSLGDDGILGVLTVICRRVTSNLRRQKGNKGEQLADTRLVPAAFEQQTQPTAIRALNLLKTTIKAEYCNKVARILLGDIAAEADPPLRKDNVISGMILPIFLGCSKI